MPFLADQLLSYECTEEYRLNDNLWLRYATSLPHETSHRLLCSLVNTALSFDPVGWGVPYASLLYSEQAEQVMKNQQSEQKESLESHMNRGCCRGVARKESFGIATQDISNSGTDFIRRLWISLCNACWCCWTMSPGCRRISQQRLQRQGAEGRRSRCWCLRTCSLYDDAWKERKVCAVEGV